MKNLKNIYLEWLETTIQLNEISFEDMFILEREYKKLVVGSNEL